MKIGASPFNRLYAAVFLLALVSAVTAVSGPLESGAYDLMMRARPSPARSPDIAVIEISDDTLKELGRWPLSRHYHALLVRALSESGCRLIVFDILFSEPGLSDDSFARAMVNSGSVYLPRAFLLSPGASVKGFTAAREILAGTAESLRPAAAGFGHINVFVDPDGKVRRVPLWVKHGSQSYPALGLLAAAAVLRKSPETLSIPAGDGTGLWVNYPGPWTSSFQHFSFLDVLRAYAARQKGETPWLDLSVFRDKICFVGLTAAGTSDLRATPYDPVYPMVGTQASICSSILSGSFIYRAALWQRVALALAVTLISLWFCLRLVPAGSLAACAAFGAAYWSIAWLLFAGKGLFIDVVLPLSTIAAVYAVTLFYRFILEAQKRRVLENELMIAASIQRSFLPPDLRHYAGVNIRAELTPAKFVAGDLYDLIALDASTLGVFIGDVSGKGVSSALIMAQTISLLRLVALKSRNPAEVLAELNAQLYKILKGRFVTGQYLMLNAAQGWWEGSCAGHPPLLYYHEKDARLEELLPASGPPLGLVGSAGYTTCRQGLSAGDTLLLYTDGWTEGRSSRGAEFGTGRLAGAFLAGRGQRLDGLYAHLRDKRRQFEGPEQFDDITTVLLECGSAV